MSSIKRHIEQLEADEDMNEWIREHVDLGVEEGDPEWEEMKAIYLSEGTGEYDYWDDDEFYADEFIRLTAGNRAFSQFNEQMSTLIKELPENPSDSNIKMAYSFSVTLMETCLSDMIKSLILSDEHYLKNAIENVEELAKMKLPLKEVYFNPDIVKKVVIKTFSDYLYHNIEKIIPIYSAVLGEETPEDVKNKMAGIIKITKIRHDIVHRNGADKEGNPRQLNQQILLEAMDAIVEFIRSIHTSIEAAEYNRAHEF